MEHAHQLNIPANRFTLRVELVPIYNEHGRHENLVEIHTNFEFAKYAGAWDKLEIGLSYTEGIEDIIRHKRYSVVVRKGRLFSLVSLVSKVGFVFEEAYKVFREREEKENLQMLFNKTWVERTKRETELEKMYQEAYSIPEEKKDEPDSKKEGDSDSKKESESLD